MTRPCDVCHKESDDAHVLDLPSSEKVDGRDRLSTHRYVVCRTHAVALHRYLDDISSPLIMSLGPYRGFKGVAEWEAEGELYAGWLTNSASVCTFEADSDFKVYDAFKDAVDDLLRWREEKGAVLVREFGSGFPQGPREPPSGYAFGDTVKIYYTQPALLGLKHGLDDAALRAWHDRRSDADWERVYGYVHASLYAWAYGDPVQDPHFTWAVDGID